MAKILQTDEIKKLLNKIPFDCKGISRYILDNLNMEVKPYTISRIKNGQLKSAKPNELLAISAYFASINHEIFLAME